MACFGAPILGAGWEGRSWLPWPLQTSASHLNRCLGNLPPSLSRKCQNFSLSWTAASAILSPTCPQALLPEAWVPELVGPSAGKVEDRSPNHHWQVKIHRGKLLRRRVPQMRRTEPFPSKERPFSRLAKSLQKWCFWTKEQESKDDITPLALKFISLFDRMDPEGEMILAGEKFLNSCLLFCTIRSLCKGMF